MATRQGGAPLSLPIDTRREPWPPPQSHGQEQRPPIIAAIERVVRLSTRHARVVIAAFLIAAIVAGGYVARHIAINTDSGKLLSSSLPWRQQEIKLNKLFPQRTDLIVAVIDATTPEAADEAADALVKALADSHRRDPRHQPAGRRRILRPRWRPVSQRR